MPIPDDLALSQASLQDYADCHRRFQLRYLDRIEWPAVEAEPAHRNERRLRDGAEFHRLVHQYLLGVPPPALREIAARRGREAEEAALTEWWHAFEVHRPAQIEGTPYAEITLAAPVAGRRVAAKYDLIVVEVGKAAVIFDWKTAAKLPSADTIDRRLQTHVYPYILANAGSVLNGGAALRPDQIEMRYWFPSFPTETAVIRYDQERYDADAALIESLIREIESRAAGDFQRTEREERCRLCTYRSLCGRGTGAGSGEADEDRPPLALDIAADAMDFDFADIQEVPF